MTEIAYAGLSRQAQLNIDRSARTWLFWHCAVPRHIIEGWSHQSVDDRADAVVPRLLEEGHLSPTDLPYRVRSIRSVRTQVTEEVSEDQRDVITLDAALIRLAYHIPAHPPEGIDEEDLEETFTDYGIAWGSWEHFLTDYRRLALHLERHYEATVEKVREVHRMFLSTAHGHYGAMFENDEYFDGPEYRVTGVSDEYNRSVRSCLETSHAGLLVRVRGQITQISQIRASYYLVGWRCSVCESITDVRQNDYDDDLIKPRICGNEECSTIASQAGFVKVEAPHSRERRIRRAFVQEELVSSSDSPSVLVEFRESMSRQVEAGEVVTVVGYVRSRPVDARSKSDRNRELYIVVTGVESNEQSRDLVVADQRREEIERWAAVSAWEDKVTALTRSFAPEIHGRDKVKHGMILQQAGGSRNTFNLRSDIHISIFGDPGTGKSVLADFVNLMHPGTKYLSAERATKAGLIAGMGASGELFANTDKRVIQPGALALTPPGAVCIIDEAQHLDNGPGDLLAELNTALEKQEVTVSMTIKATIRTRAPVILIANPKKSDNAKFDPTDPNRTIVQQAGMKESTMSRMDLSYFIFDERVSEDEELRRASSIFDKMDGVDPSSRETAILPPDFLRDFFAVARTFTNVTFSEEAKSLLVRNQVDMRVSGGEEQVSQRRSASLARLAQSAAKLDFSPVVESRHALFAIETMSGAEQDKNPAVLRNALSSEAREMKTRILQHFEEIHKEKGQVQYTAKELEQYIFERWHEDHGKAPSMQQVSSTLNALVSEQVSTEHGQIMKVKSGVFSFSF